MQKRKLGNRGLEVSALGFGCMGLSLARTDRVEKAAGVALIRAACGAWGHAFSTPPKPMGRSPTRRWLAKRWRRSAIR